MVVPPDSCCGKEERPLAALGQIRRKGHNYRSKAEQKGSAVK
jgi:hypothetical protein